MSNAFIGGVQVKRGDGAGTEVFTVVPEMTIAPNLGAEYGLVEVSNYDSVQLKEYVAESLGDGAEVTMEWNLILGDTQQEGVKADIDAGTARNYEMTITDGTNTLTSSFTLIPKGWNRNTSFTEANKLSASFKISGAITDVVTP
jgi:hypothetical protein